MQTLSFKEWRDNFLKTDGKKALDYLINRWVERSGIELDKKEMLRNAMSQNIIRECYRAATFKDTDREYRERETPSKEEIRKTRTAIKKIKGFLKKHPDTADLLAYSVLTKREGVNFRVTYDCDHPSDGSQFLNEFFDRLHDGLTKNNLQYRYLEKYWTKSGCLLFHRPISKSHKNPPQQDGLIFYLVFYLRRGPNAAFSHGETLPGDRLDSIFFKRIADLVNAVLTPAKPLTGAYVKGRINYLKDKKVRLTHWE